MTQHDPVDVRQTHSRAGKFRLGVQALERQVCIAPGRIFSPDEQFRHFIRINYGHPEPNAMPAALRTLGELAATLAAKAAQPAGG